MNRASSLKNLKKRIDYFLDDTGSQQAPLAEFIQDNFEGCKPFLFGGVVRDLAIHGLNEFKSDVDIVFLNDFNISDFTIDVEKNKFGGHRAFFDRWIIDFWKAEDTWSFSNGIFVFEGVNSLLKTTHTNFESVLYDIENKKIICCERYFEDLVSGYLYIVNKQTPDQKKTLSKVFRSIYENGVISCDQSVASLAVEVFDTCDLTEFYDDYVVTGIPYAFYYKLVKRLLDSWGELLPVDVSDIHSNQKELF
ncbi:hypothetical protein C7446_0717 [Kushneria sinocarnis]|uniref:Poly A polymerase head domain-containing protein n=1 Tax=Kushneria sinocarnis TaxID=595502 RepID=A0A420WZK2_9GAMM|nr:hypothetical protein [Kushneria sinocarnis]RKR06722.1 hypothetical protein C7446_0717 [Kushneria sinocarnis]